MNDSAMRSGIVQEIRAFIAPKIFGGGKAKSPVSGEGVLAPEDADLLKLQEVTRIGEDLLLRYKVIKK